MHENETVTKSHKVIINNQVELYIYCHMPFICMKWYIWAVVTWYVKRPGCKWHWKRSLVPKLNQMSMHVYLRKWIHIHANALNTQVCHTPSVTVAIKYFEVLESHGMSYMCIQTPIVAFQVKNFTRNKGSYVALCQRTFLAPVNHISMPWKLKFQTTHKSRQLFMAPYCHHILSKKRYTGILEEILQVTEQNFCWVSLTCFYEVAMLIESNQKCWDVRISNDICCIPDQFHTTLPLHSTPSHQYTGYANYYVIGWNLISQQLYSYLKMNTFHQSFLFYGWVIHCEMTGGLVVAYKLCPHLNEVMRSPV